MSQSLCEAASLPVAARDAQNIPRRRAVLFDRDGVLAYDHGLVVRTHQLELIPGVQDGLLQLSKAGFVLLCVTNQAVVARGLITLEALKQVHAELNLALGRGQSILQQFYLCPHHPHAQLAQYRKDCSHRKPRPGMLLAAIAQWNLCATSSFMVGDRASDVLAGQRAGLRAVLFESGRHKDPPIIGAEQAQGTSPDHRVSSWPQLVSTIMRAAYQRSCV